MLTTVRAVFDSFGYLLGRAVQFDFATAIDDDTGKEHIFVDGIQELAERQHERPVRLPRLLTVVLGSVHLTRALADLRRTMEYPWDTAFFAFRSVENVRQGFTTGSDKREASWEALRTALAIDRSWLDTLKVESTGGRHGEPRSLTGTERTFLIERAWRVVDRYAVYLDRGGKEQLPAAEFPLLKA